MLIPEIDPNFINKIFSDQYGRTSAVLLLDKPAGVTSHDVVDDVRRILRTKKVGHAGALDPFARGLLIILVGKYTRYTEPFINLDKAYKAAVTLGVSTSTQDPEGSIVESKDIPAADVKKYSNKKYLEKTLQAQFMPAYEQIVPIFSSVKIDGNKLRKLARAADTITFLQRDLVKFEFPDGKELEVELPAREVEITELEVDAVNPIGIARYADGELQGKFLHVSVNVSCSKGTYIRQLAEDIGLVLGYPSYLSELTRTQIASYSVNDSISLAELYERAVNNGIQKQPLENLNLRTIG